MKFGILGTGNVGETIASKLIELGHEVKMGARDAANEKASAWAEKSGERASNGTFAEAAAFGEMVFGCGKGAATLAILELAGKENLRGKVLVDVANPLDFSKGMPPSLTVCNTDSLAEQTQRAYPETLVVKALNTMWCGLMVNPRMLPESHQTYVSGDDEGAKGRVRDLLKTFGWTDDEILDLGDITTARGTEMFLPLWVRIFGATGSGAFNFKRVVVPPAAT